MSQIKDKIVEAIQDKKGKNIISLNMNKVDGAICDDFVICNADSTIQVSAIVDGIEEKLRETLGERVLRTDGTATCYWVVMDYGEVVVHVFQTEAREYYKLEDLWMDAPLTKYESEE